MTRTAFSTLSSPEMTFHRSSSSSKLLMSAYQITAWSNGHSNSKHHTYIQNHLSTRVEEFKNSVLCDMSIITALPHSDEMVKHYNDVITNLVDRLAPILQVICRRRKSDLWFDKECHQLNQHTRLLERRYLAMRRLGDKAAWRSTVCNMHQAFRVKSRQFWTSKISKETERPRQLWSSIDHLLGNFRSSTSSCFTADDFVHFFQCKVADIRISTEDAIINVYAFTRLPTPRFRRHPR